MAITKKDVKNLADLARIEIDDKETGKMTKEIDSILVYVGQIKEVKVTSEKVVLKLHNVMRDDVVTNAPNQYAEKILRNAPAREKSYLKVKKIL